MRKHSNFDLKASSTEAKTSEHQKPSNQTSRAIYNASHGIIVGKPYSQALQGSSHMKYQHRMQSYIETGLPTLCKEFLPGFKDWNLATKCAFNIARDLSTSEKQLKEGKSDRNIDIKEFHALLIAFLYYLELYILFQAIDISGDQNVTFEEISCCLPLLEKWGIDEHKVQNKFGDAKCLHTRNKALKFEDFAQWCISQGIGSWNLKLDDANRMTVKVEAGRADLFTGASCSQSTQGCTMSKSLEDAQNSRKLMEAFMKWDLDHSGYIDEHEMTTVLMAVDKKYTPEVCRKILAAADANNDGKVDYEEFIAWLFNK